MITADIATRVTWECIHLGTLAEGREEIDRSKQKDIFAARFSAEDIDGKEDLLSRISEALRFPTSFGGNWDALDDYLRDLSWLRVKGVLLVIENSEHLWCERSLSGTLIESWLCCAEYWAQNRVPFHLAFTWG